MCAMGTPQKGRMRRSLSIATIVGILLLSVGFILYQHSSGVRVKVKNMGAKPIHSVVLHVTGESHQLGDIAPGEFARATVSPSGESSLQIDFSEANGNKRRLDVDCYMERGYVGVIEVSLKDGHIDAIEERVRPRLY